MSCIYINIRTTECKLALCLINEQHYSVWRRGGVTPPMFKFGTREKTAFNPCQGIGKFFLNFNIVLTYLFTYLLTYLLHGAESFLKSKLVCS